MLRLFATAALLLTAVTTASADVLCDRCEYAEPGIYLGGYWPGDRGTFQRTTPTVAIGTWPDGRPKIADDFYVIDVYDHGTFTLQVRGGVSAWIHFDTGEIVCAGAGEICSSIVVGSVYVTKGPRQRTASTPVDSNRYVLRIRTSEVPPGTTYSGTLTLRK